MPTKAKAAEVDALAGAMLRELSSLRDQGGEAYPPRLRQLAERAGGSPTDELVQKAAAKTAFTAKAVVTEKVGRKPSLDGPVYFKEDVPRPDPAGDLARRMLVVLEAERRLGAGAYPPTLGRLAELCDLNASDTRVAKAAGHKALTEVAVVAAKLAKGKPGLDPPVVLKADLHGDLADVLPALLRFGLSAVTTGGKTPTELSAFTASEVGKRFLPALQKPVQAALERAIERRVLPEGVAWVVTKSNKYLFLVENLRTGTPPPSEDFAGAFREAFEELDRRNGATNFVTLADLRRVLGRFGREAFDSGLRALRLAGEFSLDSHEGLHAPLTPEERDAGVREAGSLLVYVSRS